jgi:HK97 family phage major capsid protein
MPTILELREKHANLITEAQAVSGGAVFGAEENQTFERIMNDADAVRAQIQAMEKVATLANSAQPGSPQIQPQMAVAGTDGDAKALYRAAFDTYVRFGKDALTDDQRRLLQSGYAQQGDIQAGQTIATPNKGGYTVPEGFMSQIDIALKSFVGVEEAGAHVIETDSGQAIPWPTTNDTGNTGRIITELTVPTGTDVTFGSTVMGAFTFTSDLVQVANELLQDTGLDLDKVLGHILAERVGRAQNNYFTVGDGTGEPTGVVTAAADSGVTAANDGTFSYDNLVDLVHSVDNEYRKLDACFMLSDLALRQVVKLKDGENRPLYVPAIAEKVPGTILGYRHVVNNAMAAPAASAKSVLFGHFGHYKIRRVKGGKILRLEERYADLNATAFLLFKRADGQLLNAGAGAVKFMDHAAA